MKPVAVRIASVLVFAVLLGAVGAARAADPQRSYVWFGEFVSLDEAAKTATMKAPIPEHVAKYVDRFKAGDRLVVVWDMIGKTQATTVLALWKYDDVKDSKGGNAGFVLPVEFVSADVQNRTVTFVAKVPDRAVSSLKSAPAGQWIKVTAPMDQPSQDATITSIDTAERPQAASGA
jgi:hypothetical protein